MLPVPAVGFESLTLSLTNSSGQVISCGVLRLSLLSDRDTDQLFE